MGRLHIARLTDMAAMRTIRLEALRLHPEAFCADLETVEAMGPEEFRALAAKAAWFGGYVGDALGGMVVFSRPGTRKLAHTGKLVSMYVRREYRGQGLADALIEGVIDHAIGQVEQLKLTVNAENPRAIALYERHGFRIVGRMPHAIRVAERTYDEIVMVRGVSASD